MDMTYGRENQGRRFNHRRRHRRPDSNVSIKEIDPALDVMIVEKQTCGYSGKANKGGGCCSILT